MNTHTLNIKALWKWEEDELDDLSNILKQDHENIIPSKLIVNNMNKNTNNNLIGEYRYINHGGCSCIFINDSNQTPIILKLIYSEEIYNREVEFQHKAGEFSPNILYNTRLDKLENEYILLDEEMLEYWEGNNNVNYKIKGLCVLGNSPINIIIMEYLNVSIWKSLLYMEIHAHELNNEIKKTLINMVHSLVYDKNIYNIFDFVGYTGEHIFYNKNVNKFKIIDYGGFKTVKNNQDKDILVKQMLENIYDKYEILKLN